jgi:hypothetical protein
MNRFHAIDKLVALCFAVAVLVAAVYVGADHLAATRKDFHQSTERYLHQKLEESKASLPAGLNGQYPAQGPMADYYRNNPQLGVEVEPR